MNITRKAVLIGDSGSPTNHLPGVEVDVRNYLRYLKSGIGGSWKDNEIEVLVGKTGIEVRNYIANLYNDYIFVAYSGHGGFTRTASMTYIELKGDDFPETILVNANCSWQLNILDTCRSFIDEKPVSKGFSVLNESLMKANLDTSAFFLKELEQCEKGLIKIYSAGIGEAADEEPNEGGLYSFNQLKVSVASGSANQFGTSANINEIFNPTKQIVQRKSNNRQNPEILAGRRRYYPPFSMGGSISIR